MKKNIFVVIFDECCLSHGKMPTVYLGAEMRRT